MKIGKRQLVLASLVLALGAAVYLNWVFSGDQKLVATDALTSEKEYGQAQLVNASGETLEESALSQAPEESTAESGTEPETASTAGKSHSATLAEARLSRQQARDSATELLEDFLKEGDASSEELKAAAEKAAEIADAILQEDNIENLIKAKGYEDCVAMLENGECNIMVMIETAQPNDTVVIKDIVRGQTDLTYDKIKIIEVD